MRLKRLAFMKYFETDRGFYIKLVKIAFPVAAQSVITTGVNLIDTIMLGQLDETALSASSLANQFIMLFLFICMGISMGASVLSSRYWGAKNLTSLKKVVAIALRCGLLLAGVFTLVNIAAPEGIMGLYIEDRDIIQAGASYLRWSTITYILMALTTVTTNIMRSVGLDHVPFISACCAFGVNIGANYVFIFGKFGAPAMGVAGAALGTVIARVLEVFIICGYFFFRNKVIAFQPKDILMTQCGDLVSEFIRISVPVMLSDGLLGVGDNVLASIMGHIGGNFVSANSITNVLSRVSTIFITGLAYAGCFITGQTLGDRDVEGAKRQGNTFLALGLGIGILAAVIIQVISGPMLSAYKITQETYGIARQLVYAISIIIVFRSTNSILTKGVLRGGGDTKFLLAADMSTMWLIAIPLGAFAGLVLDIPPFWVFICLHADQIVKAVWCVFRLKSGKWIKKIKGAEL